MTPFASVAMLEKLALLKIARCRAPALSSTSSACLREVTSPALAETPILVLVAPISLAIVLPPVTDGQTRQAPPMPMCTEYFPPRVDFALHAGPRFVRQRTDIAWCGCLNTFHAFAP